MKEAFVFWFTGLSGSGKTTLAEIAAGHFSKRRRRVKVYDGDAVRKRINKDLTFSPGHIRKNNRIIAELCAENKKKYDYIFVPVISPFEDSRRTARKIIGDSFRLIYVKASLEEVIRRDPKGLYKKALGGKIKNFIGLSKNVPYEPPKRADLVLDTEDYDAETAADKLIGFVKDAVKAGGERWA